MIYVSSRTSPTYAAIWKSLRDEGYPISSSWIDSTGSDLRKDFESAWMCFEGEIAAASSLVLYVGQRADFPLASSLVEVGMAIAMAKRIFVAMPKINLTYNHQPAGSWVKHPLVTLLTHDDALRTAMDMARDGGVK